LKEIAEELRETASELFDEILESATSYFR